MLETVVKYEQVKKILKSKFGVLDEVLLYELFSESKCFSILEGTNLTIKGNANEGLTFLLEGILTIELSNKGKTHIAHFIHIGEVFYANECFLNIPNQSSCKALIQSKILQIPLSLIKKLCQNNPLFMIQMLTWGCDEKAIFEQHAVNLIGTSVKLRFLNALKVLAIKFKDQSNYIPIQPDLIGNFILASKSSLLRCISELEQKNIIRSDKNGIHILQGKYFREVL
jgi:CRP-like cAMP-binding protein